MTVEYWRDAELFYELWIVLLGLLMLILVIVSIFVLSYTNKTNRKKASFILLAFMTIVGLISLGGHFKYRPYLEPARFNNALIRDREPKLHMYQYYSEAEETIYSHLNGIESLRKMVLYKEEPVVEPLTYLGEDENFHYFKRSNGDLFKQTLQVKFKKTAEQTQLKGSRFTLKDENFMEIGFRNPEQTMYDSIEIPTTEQEKIFDAEDQPFIPRIENSLLHWNF